jgi:hypothetical protein
MIDEKRREALIKTLEIYANTDCHVTQGFYQGLCIEAKKYIIELQAENKELKRRLRNCVCPNCGFGFKS